MTPLDPPDLEPFVAELARESGSRIGLLHRGQPVLGAIHQPILGAIHQPIKRYKSRARFESIRREAAVFRTWGDCCGYLLVATGRADVMGGDEDPARRDRSASAWKGRRGHVRKRCHITARGRRGLCRRAGPTSAVGALLITALAACADGPATLVISGATLIDGTGAAPVPDGVVVSQGGLITCAGAVGTCAIPEGADVLDATGFWVTPGLIDAVVSPDGELPGETEERRERLRFLMGVTTARLAVPRGFTAETSPGAMAWMRGDGTGAGHPVPWRLVHEFSGGLESLAIDGAPPGRVSLTALAAEVASREVMEGRAPPADPRAAGLAARAPWLEADETALTESARRLAASGTWLAPLLLSEELWSGPYRLPLGLHRLLQMPLVTLALQDRTLPDRTPEEVHLLEQALDRMRSFVREFSDAGGTVVVGSGGVLAPGLSVHEEMGALVAAGLTPAEAFAAATRSAAIAIGVDDAAGTIRPGLRADLLVLEGDPLADIANAQLVSRIVKGGVLHDPATELDELEGGPTVTLTNARVWIGFFATGVVVFILLIVVRRHAAGLAGG